MADTTPEEYVRDYSYTLIDFLRTNNLFEYGQDDYLYVLNQVTDEEFEEIKNLLSTIEKSLDRINEIQEDCYGR